MRLVISLSLAALLLFGFTTSAEAASIAEIKARVRAKREATLQERRSNFAEKRRLARERLGIAPNTTDTIIVELQKQLDEQKKQIEELQNKPTPEQPANPNPMPPEPRRHLVISGDDQEYIIDDTLPGLDCAFGKCKYSGDISAWVGLPKNEAQNKFVRIKTSMPLVIYGDFNLNASLSLPGPNWLTVHGTFTQL